MKKSKQASIKTFLLRSSATSSSATPPKSSATSKGANAASTSLSEGGLRLTRRDYSHNVELAEIMASSDNEHVDHVVGGSSHVYGSSAAPSAMSTNTAVSAMESSPFWDSDVKRKTLNALTSRKELKATSKLHCDDSELMEFSLAALPSSKAIGGASGSKRPTKRTSGNSAKKRAKVDRSTQMFLELGQKGFNQVQCGECGMLYAPGQREDEEAHAKHHAARLKPIEFGKKWSKQFDKYVVRHFDDGGGVLRVHSNGDQCDSRALLHRMDQVRNLMDRYLGYEATPRDPLFNVEQTYVYVSRSGRAVGCCTAEPCFGANPMVVDESKQSNENVATDSGIVNVIMSQTRTAVTPTTPPVSTTPTSTSTATTTTAATNSEKAVFDLSNASNVWFTPQASCLSSQSQEGNAAATVADEKAPEAAAASTAQVVDTSIVECTHEQYRTSVGIGRIWVSSNHRREGVGTRLLDCVRGCFYHGHTLKRKELAFAQPTRDGKAFFLKYCASEKHVLVY